MDAPPVNIELHIDWERAETGWLLSHLRRYLDVMEASLQDASQLERTTLLATRHEYDDEGDWSVVISDYDRMFEDDFPTKLRFSFMVLLYSYLELRTESFCAELLRRGVVSGGPFTKLPRCSHLTSVQRFCDRYAPLTTASLPWRALLDLEQLRHCIVHESGVIARAYDPQLIKDILARSPGLSRGYEGEIRVELSYLKSLLDTTKLFFDTAFDTAGFYPKHDVVRETP